MPTPPHSDGVDAAALAEGADLSAPDGVNRFRQQLIADVDELLREHHSRIAQHVEENMEDLYLRLATMVVSKRNVESIRSKLQNIMPRHSQRSSMGRASREEEAAAVPVGHGTCGSTGLVSEGTLAKISVADCQLEHRRLPAERGSSGTAIGVVRAAASADTSAAQGEQLAADRGSMAHGTEDNVRTLGSVAVEPQVSKVNTTSVRVRCIRSYSQDMIQKWRSAKGHSMVLSATPESDAELSQTTSAAVDETTSGDTSSPPIRKTIAERRKSIGVRAHALVNSNVFESVTCMLIVTNSMFFGVETQFMAMGIQTPVFDHITLGYTVVFTCELILRMIAEGRGFFWNTHWLWNVVDTFVVCMSLVELSFQVSDAHSNMNLTYVRIIRIARTVRIFRVVRVLQAFSSLRILLYCVLNTLRSLVWTMVLLLSILYIFGILFTQAAAEVLSLGGGQWTDPSDQQNFDALKRYFGSLHVAIFTQFKAVTGGVTWQEVSGPLAFVHPFWEFLFTVFISFTYFAVLNVVTGVFCQSAIESAANDKDMVVQAQLSNKKLYTEQLRDLFKCIDAHHQGKVNFDMLESCLDDPQCQAYFEVLGITSDDAWNLFKLLDDDDSNQIELEEFVSGCLRLRGSARSIDSHMLLYESRWTMRKVTCLLEAFNELLVQLNGSGEELMVQPIITDRHAPTFDLFEKHKEENHHHHHHHHAQQQEASSGESTTDSPGSQRHEETHGKGKSGEQRHSSSSGGRRSGRHSQGGARGQD